MPPDSRLRDAFSSPPRKRAYVRRLFTTIADRYDLITVLLSFGRDRNWKRRLVELAGSDATGRALDLACGTGDIALQLAGTGARVVGLDITYRMLELARRKRSAAQAVSFVLGDAMTLPFPDATFDLVTTGYGIRNAPVIAPALGEIYRVLRPGGLFLSLDFNRPANGLVRAVYLSYLTIVGSLVGLALHRDPDTYRYIPESIRRYPGATAICGLAREQGFRSCEWFPVLGGLMALHRARK